MSETKKAIVQTSDEHMRLYNLALDFRDHPEDYSSADVSDIIECELVKAWNKGYQERCYPTN